MGKSQRDKGAKFEREIVKKLRADALLLALYVVRWHKQSMVSKK